MNFQLLEQRLIQKYHGDVDELILDRSHPWNIVKLAGDASTRRYYRVQVPSEGSLIIMRMDPKTMGSEEAVTISKQKQERTEISFVNIHRFLSKYLDLPKIYTYFKTEGIIFLEDAGDTLLQYYIQGRSSSEIEAVYRSAIDALVSVQVQSNRHQDTTCYAFSRAFNRELFNWEFNHFVEYELHQAIEFDDPWDIPAGEIQILNFWFDDVSKELASLPFYFSHRDYHSRNILIFNDRMVFLDFQDALMAPQTYDLASLLMDAYVTLPDPMVQNLVDYYSLEFERVSGQQLDKKNFHRLFDLTAIQRLMKAAGRFTFIDVVKKNPSFLKFIPNCLVKIKSLLSKYPECEHCLQILSDYHPGFEGS